MVAQENKVCELIKRRRLQMLIHSIVYEQFNESIISDRQWDIWAKELYDLQEKHPKESRKVWGCDIFYDWTGDTASIIANRADEKAIGKAKYILSISRKRSKDV